MVVAVVRDMEKDAQRRHIDMGVRIRFARGEAGLTQKAVSDMLGVSRTAVTQWETGVSAPTRANLERLSQVLSVSIDSLVGAAPLGLKPPPDLGGGDDAFKLEVLGLHDPTHEAARSWLRGKPRRTAWQVRGQSLTSSGILPGDIVIVDPETPPMTRAIVAALVAEHVIIRVLYGDWLFGSPPAGLFVPPIPTQAAVILGRAVALVRSFSTNPIVRPMDN